MEAYQVTRWQVQEAKQRFSEVVRRAMVEGPQTVTRRGEEVVVVLSSEQYRRLSSSKPDFKTFLLSGPDLGELNLERAQDMPREIEL
jgi:prevent-host-death family protein